MITPPKQVTDKDRVRDYLIDGIAALEKDDDYDSWPSNRTGWNGFR